MARNPLLAGTALAVALALTQPEVCLAQASTLSKAARTSESMEPALAFPAQEQTVQRKLDALRAKTGKRPNIVWFVIDDMGWGDPGAYGGGAAVGAATPNMDRLAREGLKLTSCYSQATCTPTRSAILTERLPFRTGLTRPILAGDKITKNPWADEISLPKLLGDAGYTTVLSGKWHVGEAEGMRPHDVGFDEFYGYYPAQKELTQAIDKRRYPDLVLNPERLKMLRDTGASEALIHGFRGGQTREVHQIDSLEVAAEMDRVTKDFSVAKIKELANGNQPFFLEHSFMKVHADNFASKDFEGKSASKYPYKDAVVEVDAYIGEWSRRSTKPECWTTPSSS